MSLDIESPPNKFPRMFRTIFMLSRHLVPLCHQVPNEPMVWIFGLMLGSGGPWRDGRASVDGKDSPNQLVRTPVNACECMGVLTMAIG